MSRSSKKRNAGQKEAHETKRHVASQPKSQRAQRLESAAPNKEQSSTAEHVFDVIAIFGAFATGIQTLRGDRTTASIAGLGTAAYGLWKFRAKLRQLPAVLRHPNASTMVYTTLAFLTLASLTILPLSLLLTRLILGSPSVTKPHPYIVAVANYERPGQRLYGITDRLLHDLKALSANDHSVEILPLNTSITEENGGSQRARSLGSRRHASIVLWGYYTSFSSLVATTIYVEIMGLPPTLLFSSASTEYDKPIASVSTIRIQVSRDMEYVTLVTLGLSFYVRHDYRDSMARLVAALKYAHTSGSLVNLSDTYLYLGNSAMYVSQFQRAYDAYTASISHNKRNSAAYADRGQVDVILGKVGGARRDLDSAVYYAPGHAEPLFYRATLLYYLRDLKGALRDMNQVVALAPNVAVGHMNRGIVEMELGDYSRAEGDYRRAMLLDPRNAMVFNNLGNLYLAKGRTKRAIQEYNAAISLDARDGVAYAHRGIARLILGQMGEAAHDYEVAVRVSSGDAFVHVARGQYLFSVGRYQDAIAEYTAAIRVNGRFKQALVLRAQALEWLGDWKQALADYRRAVALRPGDVDTYQHMCSFLLRLRGRRQAVACMEAAAADKSNSDGYAFRGAADYLLGDLKKALQEFSKAISLNERNEIAHRGRGGVLLDLGMPRRATVDLSRAVELDPQDAAAYETRGDAFIVLHDLQHGLDDYRHAARLYGTQQDIAAYRRVQADLARYGRLASSSTS